MKYMRPLTIGFLGRSQLDIRCGLGMFVENNKDQIKLVYRRDNRIILKDGSLIIGLYLYPSKIKGLRLDQLILFDYFNWNDWGYMQEIINLIKEECMCFSCVPEKFQILKY